MAAKQDLNNDNTMLIQKGKSQEVPPLDKEAHVTNAYWGREN